MVRLPPISGKVDCMKRRRVSVLPLLVAPTARKCDCVSSLSRVPIPPQRMPGSNGGKFLVETSLASS